LLLEILQNFLGWSEDDVRSTVNIAPLRYRIYRVNKPNGGTRTIFHPARETKALQYALMYSYLDRFPVHDIAIGYRSGFKSPIRSAAVQHAAKPYSVSIDSERFFPSIVPEDLLTLVDPTEDKLGLSVYDREILRKALFVEFRGKQFLAIGAPSSPMVSNAVMYNMDAKLHEVAMSIDPDAIVSRYADDITFSSSRKGSSNGFVEEVEGLLQEIQHPRLRLNTRKTRFASRGSRRHFLGLTITPEGAVKVGRDRKRWVQGMIHKSRCGALSENERENLRGHLAYLRDVEPSFLNTLVLKYGGKVLEDVIRPASGG